MLGDMNEPFIPLHCIHELKGKLYLKRISCCNVTSVSEKSYFPLKKVPKYACINIQLRNNPSLGACTYLNPPPI